MQLNVLEQFKLYKQYQSIVSSAERFFKTSAVFNNFKDEAYKAYNEGNLDDFQFAIDTLTTLEASQNSPLYIQQVDMITDSPQFDNFVSLLSTISSPHQQEKTIEAPTSVTTAIGDSLQIGEEQNIIHTESYTPAEASSLFPQTNKIVIDTNTFADQGDKFISGDGIITNPQAFTNNQIEQARFESFVKQISESTTVEETEAIIDEYTPGDTPTLYAPVEDTTSMAIQQFEYEGQTTDTSVVQQEIENVNAKVQEEVFKLKYGAGQEDVMVPGVTPGSEPTMG